MRNYIFYLILNQINIFGVNGDDETVIPEIQLLNDHFDQASTGVAVLVVLQRSNLDRSSLNDLVKQSRHQWTVGRRDYVRGDLIMLVPSMICKE